MSKILDKMYLDVRDLIQDNLSPGNWDAEFVSDLIFTLPDATIQESSLKVYINKVLIENNSGNIKYTFDVLTSRVTFENQTGLLTPGDLVEFYYNSYKRYTDAELRQYINSAIIKLSVERYNDFILGTDDNIFPTPVLSDGRLICFIASVLIGGNISRYRTPEIEMVFGAGESNETIIRTAIWKFRKTYGVIDYVNLRDPYTLFVGYIEDEG